jgi:hypothetical protein
VKHEKGKIYMPSKIYQVRYTVGDKTVAHEHYTEKGAKADAKVLSKAIGNAMMGEIDVLDDGAKSMSRVWEFTGGEMGKPIKREGPPTDVEVIKSAEQTKLPEGPVEKKPKAPKMTEEEKLAKRRADALAVVAAIDAGTFVAPSRGRKAGTGAPKAPKDEADRIKKIITDLTCSEKAAQLLVGAGLNATGRRARSVVTVVDANAPILASEVVAKLNAAGKEDRTVDIDDVMGDINHANFKFSKFEQPWRFTIKPKENDNRLNLVTVKIEYGEDTEEAQAAE